MDPLFERREMTKKVKIHAKFIQKNIQASLLAQLKMQYQGRCSAEGYIHKDSLTIINYSLGRVDYLKGGVNYDVIIQADVCLPHPGQRLKAPVTLRSKIGVHAETGPIKVLIPRDLHIGDAQFDSISPDEEVEFEVIGSQFKQGDEYIVVVGKLTGKNSVEVDAIEETQELQLPTFMQPPPTPSGDVKSVVITAPTTPVDDKPKRRKLKRADGS
jgi:DNA-directed RNA polymerase subunit E'/Rpb7